MANTLSPSAGRVLDSFEHLHPSPEPATEARPSCPKFRVSQQVPSAEAISARHVALAAAQALQFEIIDVSVGQVMSHPQDSLHFHIANLGVMGQQSKPRETHGNLNRKTGECCPSSTQLAEVHGQHRKQFSHSLALDFYRMTPH